jgi:hypoxanthine phosphoribosyltransferase
MSGEIGKVIVHRDIIREKVKELGKAISDEYRGKDLILIGVLKGGFVFLADLMREIDIPVDMDLISVSSYGASTTSSGFVRIIMDIDIDIKGKNVIIVEDLIDSGYTLKYLKELLKMREPESIKICTAFDKPSRRKADIEIDYKGIIIPDKFVVGYGLDYAGRFRNLPDICELVGVE